MLAKSAAFLLHHARQFAEFFQGLAPITPWPTMPLFAPSRSLA